MIVKLIEVRVRPGHMAEYLEAQEIWNRQTRKAPGALGQFCGISTADENVVHLIFFWRTRQDYEQWMAEDHGHIVQKAGADKHYEKLVVRILEPAYDDVPLLPPGMVPEERLEAADVQLWSEIYRSTHILRSAVRLKLFDRLRDGPLSASALAGRIAAESGVPEEPSLVDRLCRGLAAMGILDWTADGWANTPLATRLLLGDSASYQGHMILHNSNPAVMARWSLLGERLGLPPDVPGDPQASQELFLRAMSDTCAGGQAEVLIAAVDLRDCRLSAGRGGGAGDYSIALCRAFPQLQATVLDLPQSERLARDTVLQAGMEQQVRFLGGDFRLGPFPGPTEAILISNVLRGETPDMLSDILRRAFDALVPGGQLIVTDLFPESPPAHSGLSASLFYLHVSHGANLSLLEMAECMVRAGFRIEKAERFSRCVTMNGIVVGRRPSE